MEIDRYTIREQSALEVLSTNGESRWNGVHRSTIRAFARRKLVFDLGDGRAILTPLGNQTLAILEEVSS